MSVKILFAEDEPDLRRLVANYLFKEGFEIVCVENGEQAIDEFFTNQFSLVILDVMMPKVDGFEVCKTIRKESNVPIVMLTARNSEYDELVGFKQGADEYIAKPFKPAILVTRVKSLLKRSGLGIEDIVEIDNIKLLIKQHEVLVDNQKITLTPKEFELLSYLISNKNIALSREQILTAVWGFDYFGDERTVDTHIKCLRAKLGECGNKIKTIRKHGYKFE